MIAHDKVGALARVRYMRWGRVSTAVVGRLSIRHCSVEDMGLVLNGRTRMTEFFSLLVYHKPCVRIESMRQIIPWFVFVGQKLLEKVLARSSARLCLAVVEPELVHVSPHFADIEGVIYGFRELHQLVQSSSKWMEGRHFDLLSCRWIANDVYVGAEVVNKTDHSYYLSAATCVRR